MRLLLALVLLGIPSTSSESLHHVCGADYNDASINCKVNPTCLSGDGCPADKDTCFALPDYACLDLTDSPTPAPNGVASLTAGVTDSPTPSPVADDGNVTDATTTTPPRPTHIFVCGEDYPEALLNCLDNDKCTNGDGCPGNTTCYAIPSESCQERGGSPDDDETEPTPAPVESSLPPSEGFTPEPSTSTNATTPTPAPTYNTRFCGSNYTDATDNCSLESACPGGFECSNGQTCFAGISCLALTPVPTESPTRNNRFCGMNYTDANDNCSFERACTLGECGDGMQCYAGIMCPATSAAPTPSPSLSPTISIMPTENFTVVPTPAPTANTQFCGMNYTHAIEGCDEIKACPLGTECSNGEACFAGIVCAKTEEPTPSPTRHTQYCGYNWTDATVNCGQDGRECPSGFGCGDGMTCYAGVSCPIDTVVPTPAPFTNGTLSPVGITSSPIGSSVPTVAPNSTAPTPASTSFCGTNYTDANDNCSIERACPLGFECGENETCFAGISCPVPPVPDAPSGSPTEAPTLNNRFCGYNYTNAEGGCSFETACPVGDECGDGMACFTGIFCPATTAAPVSSTPTETVSIIPTPAPTPFTQFCGMNYTDANDNCSTDRACPLGFECTNGMQCYSGISCPVPNITAAPVPPSPAPTRNTQHCGYNWTDATENCGEEGRECPSGFGCPDGMTCYAGVTCPIDTESPTLAPVTSAPVGATESPTVAHTRFCGWNHVDATDKCSLATACPDGQGCPDGTACFQNVACAGLYASPSPTPASGTSNPSFRGTAAPTTTSTVTNATVNNWYCGSSPQDAADNCNTNTPCPDGTASSCDLGQTCFSLPSVCNATSSDNITSTDNAIASPSMSPTTTSTAFCGINWQDAKDNCLTATPCTPGSTDECPDNLGCFGGIINCMDDSSSAFSDSAMHGDDSQGKQFDFGTDPYYVKSSSEWRKPSLVVGLVAVIAAMLKWIVYLFGEID